MSYTLISTQTLTGSATAITFSSIPQTFTDLLVVHSIRSDSTSGSAMSANVTFNDSASGYSERILYNSTSGQAASGSRSGTFFDWAGLAAASGTGSTGATFSSGYFYVPNYTSSAAKSISSDSVQETNSSTMSYYNYYKVAGAWSGSAAVTSIKFTSSSGNFVTGSTVSIYGITRIPTATLGTTPTVDYLVVAGGGGGGSRSGGGGGAGGLRTASAFSVAPGSALTITVGAGGAGATTSTSSPGVAGSNSVFSSITAVGGGAGAGEGGTGGAGGSGGGAGAYGSSTTVGAGTSGQGNNGGLAAASSSNGAAGGGGAASVGGNGTTTVGGNGGAGALSTYSGSSIYYAGGGGGGTQYLGYAGGSGGSGGGGAGGVAATSAGSAGLANTGGGGGGGGASAGVGYAGGNGGSGVVVIRYPDTYNAPASVTGSPMLTYVNGYRVYTWTASGTITF